MYNENMDFKEKLKMKIIKEDGLIRRSNQVIFDNFKDDEYYIKEIENKSKGTLLGLIFKPSIKIINIYGGNIKIE